MEAIQLRIKEQYSNLEYLNSFGAIFNNEIILHKYRNSNPIPLDSVLKIKFLKKRKLVVNYVFLFFAVAGAISLYKLQYPELITNVIGCASVFLLFLLSFFLKNHEYKVLLVTNNYQVNYIVVEKYLKEDAKIIFQKIQKKINKQKKQI
ncbi:hypothetical protein [Flavobacterium sp.]